MIDKLNAEHQKQLLDHNSPIPLHYQLTEILRKEFFEESDIDPSEKIPAEVDIAKRFNVSRVTVRTALKTLVDEGLLSRERGRGTFIKTNKAEKWTGQLMGFSETIQSAGFTPRGHVLHKGMNESPPKDVQQLLNSNIVWEMKRLRFADDQPIGIEHSLIIPEIGSQLEHAQNLDNIINYQYIEQELNLTLKDANQLVTAVNATSEEAQMLEISERDALLYIERLTKSIDGRPIILLRAKYRPDYFHYTIDLKR